MNQTELTWGAGRNDWNLEELVQEYQSKLNPDALYYLEKRGLSADTAERFRVGFEPGRIGFYVDCTLLGDFFENRIIVPILMKDGTVADLISRAIDHREPKYKLLYGIEDIFFHEKVLDDSDDVVLCNGIFDVMTLHQSNFPAVCVPNLLVFKESHAEKLRGKRVFICMGNDETGRREAMRIESLLEDCAGETYIVRLPESVRDINELFVKLQTPSEAFIRLLNQAIEETIYAPVAPDIRHVTVFNEEYLKRRRIGDILPATGLNRLDALLSGGLPTGLTLLAGRPGSGKTTLLKQIADRIAACQQPVVMLTWDMSPFELWAISIARAMGVSTGSVLRGDHDPEAVQAANQAYMQAGNMQWTLECTESTQPEQIESSVERVTAAAGKAPVLMIDHLFRLVDPQRSVPSGGRDDVRLRSVYKLKEWAREWNVPVIAALPAEREDELALDLRATADVLIFLEPKGNTADGAKSLRLRVLKNRSGRTGDIPVKFVEAKAHFTDNMW